MKREEYTKYKQINNYNKGKNNTTYSNQTVEYYKKVEKNTISNTSGINNSRYKQNTSTAYNNSSYNHGNKIGKTNSFSSNYGNLNNSYSSKQKFSFAEKVKEKNNYIYYVSGVGYVNKNEDNKNTKNVIKVNNPPPKPKPKPKERISIKIQQTKNISDMRKELVDNYQYHETKDLKKEKKESVVTHKRLCEPVYTTVQNNSKKYSSHTEQPKTINKSYQRKEYEIIETKKPSQQNINRSNINISTNYRRENQNTNMNKYNININKQNSRSVKHYSNIDENRRQKSFSKRDDNDKIKNNYVYNRKEISVDKKRNNIRSDNINITNINNMSNRNYIRERENKINTNTNQNRISNRIYTNRNKNENQNQNYNNLQRHEIRAVSKDKATINNYSKGSINIIESKRPFHRITRDNNPINVNINKNQTQNTRINRRNVYESRTQEINQRIKNVYNTVNNNRNTVEVFEHRGNYFPLEAVRQIEHIYELNRGENIPQQMEQIAIYERGDRDRLERMDEPYTSDIQMDFNQISQNVPQQVQEIEVHEKRENIPQHVQQIEVYEGNNNRNNGENISQDIEKNEDIYQNMEEENIEQNNFEQQEEVKDEQEIYNNNQENQELEMENKEIEEHEEKNIDIMQNNEQTDLNEVEQNIENIDDLEEKEGNLQLETNIQMEEEFEEENKNEKLQMQQTDYDNYIPGQNIKPFIPDENNTREEELYNTNQNQRQYENNRFNNEQNYTHFCPIHGIYHTPYNQNIIYDMQGQFQQNRNIYPEIDQNGMVINADNYKFYESKNLKNEEDNNSLTLHHLRGEDKYMNNNTSSNIYVATKVVPIITDSNFSNYEEINSGNNINNDIENEHFHDENCPIHGDKNIQNQNK